MANEVKTELYIVHGSKKVKAFFDDLIQQCDAIASQDIPGSRHLALQEVIFSIKSEKVSVGDSELGTKWAYFDADESGSGIMTVQSAWGPPLLMVERLFSLLSKLDKKVILSGKSIDEYFQFIAGYAFALGDDGAIETYEEYKDLSNVQVITDYEEREPGKFYDSEDEEIVLDSDMMVDFQVFDLVDDLVARARKLAEENR